MGRPRSGVDETTKKSLFAGGSVLGAVAMSLCCIVPLVLFSLGVTSAWIGGLSSLYPYRWIFFLVTAGFLGGGFYMVYRKPQAGACDSGKTCATPLSDRVNKIALWTATFLSLAALAFPYYAPALLES
ncbi:MAG: mercuric transporter MerT family protein [Gammaproteobacteria bacterium]